MEDRPMDEKIRRDDGHEGRSREASNAGETDQRDELARRRGELGDRPALTRREREQQWPIG
jgi:hypothetical protein